MPKPRNPTCSRGTAFSRDRTPPTSASPATGSAWRDVLPNAGSRLVAPEWIRKVAVSHTHPQHLNPQALLFKDTFSEALSYQVPERELSAMASRAQSNTLGTRASSRGTRTVSCLWGQRQHRSGGSPADARVFWPRTGGKTAPGELGASCGCEACRPHLPGAEDRAGRLGSSRRCGKVCRALESTRDSQKRAHSEGLFGETQEGLWTSAQGHPGPGHPLSWRTRSPAPEGDAAASGRSYDAAGSTSRWFWRGSRNHVTSPFSTSLQPAP